MGYGIQIRESNAKRLAIDGYSPLEEDPEAEAVEADHDDDANFALWEEVITDLGGHQEPMRRKR